MAMIIKRKGIVILIILVITILGLVGCSTADTENETITVTHPLGEATVKKKPERIIDRAATVGGNITAKEIFDNELIKETDAYKNGKIVYLTLQV